MMNPEEILDIEEIQEPKDLTDLSWIGRAIIANNRQVALIKEFALKEIEKIKACCDQKIERLSEDSAHLEGMASVVMKCHDYSYENKNLRKYEMPGIGTFRFSVTRESVDSTDYLELEKEKQAEIQSDYPDLFNTKVSVSPDKKKIGDWIKETCTVVTGFKLKPKFEKFEFKEE